MKKIFKASLLLAILSGIGGYFVLPYQLEALPSGQVVELLDSTDLSVRALSFLTGFQIFVISFVLSFTGLRLAKRGNFKWDVLGSIVELSAPRFSKVGIIKAIVMGLGVGIIIVGGDALFFGERIGLVSELNQSMSINRLIAGVLYGGVFEEVLMRLFLMSLIVYLYARLDKRESDLGSGIYYVAIIISALLFAVGHFPATQMIFGELNAILVTRGLLLNSIGGIAFGYLYWKEGIEYGILAHMIANISVQLVFIPLFY